MNPASKTDTLNFDSLNGFKRLSLNISPPLVIAMVTFFGVIVGLFVSALGTGGNFGALLFLIVLLVVAAIAGAIIRYGKLIKQNEAILRTFAAANNMTYQAGNKDVRSPGTLFDVGDSKHMKDILSGTLNGLPFSTYAYYYETGSGKSRRTHDAMVLELTLPRVVPQFVIDSQLEHVVPLIFDKSQKIELEGDFHKYFDLYAPDSYGVSALTLLAPDSMEVLMERAALCDIEVVQNKLFFYWPVPASTKAQYEEIFATVQAVLTKLGKKLTQDDIYATKSQAKIHAESTSQGVRLKRSKLGLVAVGVFVLYFTAEVTEHTSFAGWGASFMGIFWVGIVGWLIMSGIKRTRLKNEYLNRYKAKY